jgi:hypothetical protein
MHAILPGALEAIVVADMGAVFANAARRCDTETPFITNA